MSATSVLPHSVLATSLAHHSRAVHSKTQAKICGDTAAVTLVTTLAASAASFRRADALEPFVARAQRFGRGLFVLVRTSNAGARDFQDQRVDGERLFLRVAARLAELEERHAFT